MNKIHHANGKHETAGVAILILDKVDLKMSISPGIKKKIQNDSEELNTLRNIRMLKVYFKWEQFVVCNYTSVRWGFFKHSGCRGVEG